MMMMMMLLLNMNEQDKEDFDLFLFYLLSNRVKITRLFIQVQNKNLMIART